MKKGFTLIELLAVIVILAIIALIAVPIVIDIIEDSNKNSILRSAEFYLDAVELSLVQTTLKDQTVLDGTYNILSSGNICLKYSGTTCEEELAVEVKGEVPEKGTITVINENIAGMNIILNGKVIVQNSKGEMVYYEPTLELSCKLVEGTANKIGSKYSCDFGAGARNFYILELGSDPVTKTTLKEDEVALILEGNYDTETLSWCDKKGSNPSNNSCAADGLTSKLDEIASVWINIERSRIGLPSVEQVVVADGLSEDAYENFPHLTNAWLYSWPDNPNYGKSSPIGYWTSTSGTESNPTRAWDVRHDSIVDRGTVSAAFNHGVRPVVNLKL